MGNVITMLFLFAVLGLALMTVGSAVVSTWEFLSFQLVEMVPNEAFRIVLLLIISIFAIVFIPFTVLIVSVLEIFFDGIYPGAVECGVFVCHTFWYFLSTIGMGLLFVLAAAVSGSDAKVSIFGFKLGAKTRR